MAVGSCSALHRLAGSSAAHQATSEESGSFLQGGQSCVPHRVMGQGWGRRCGRVLELGMHNPVGGRQLGVRAGL